jgi:hypothetical protein
MGKSFHPHNQKALRVAGNQFPAAFIGEGAEVWVKVNRVPRGCRHKCLTYNRSSRFVEQDYGQAGEILRERRMFSINLQARFGGRIRIPQTGWTHAAGEVCGRHAAGKAMPGGRGRVIESGKLRCLR